MKKGFLAVTIIAGIAVALGGFWIGGRAFGVNASPSAVPPGAAASSAPVSVPESSAGFDSKIESKSSLPESKPPEPAVKGIFAAHSQEAEKLLAKMSLKEKVGQLFLFRCPNEGGVANVKEYQPAGYFLMASNFRDKTKEQATAMVQALQDAAKIPLAIAVDEEGGTVCRISMFPELADHKFRSPRTVFKQGGMEGIAADAREKAELLKAYGVTVNLAPVADIARDSGDFMYDRSFGGTPEETAEFVRTVVKISNEKGISSTLKHFPGYGNNTDTHTGIALDKRSLDSFRKNDFVPFQAGIDAGAQCVLVSHNIVECMDDKPASLSPEVHRILREELGFTGVIMTDDLVMEAIPDYTGGQNPATAAFLAGNDLLLSSDIAGDFNALYKAAQDGKIDEEDINERVLRILAWKLSAQK